MENLGNYAHQVYNGCGINNQPVLCGQVAPGLKEVTTEFSSAPKKL
jgi:hypothetical protein